MGILMSSKKILSQKIFSRFQDRELGLDSIILSSEAWKLKSFGLYSGDSKNEPFVIINNKHWLEQLK